MDDLDFGATIKGFSPGQKVFGRYTLVRMLGRGGMGVVWLARDEELGRDTALKFLPEVVSTDRAAIDDMKREVRRAIDLAHPHIVKIHDFVTDGRMAAVSMEYVAGSTLSSLRVDEPSRCFAHSRLEDWLRQLCSALDYAHHDAEVVHRDLKPANLMVDARGRLKVLDFGIAASISDSVSRVSKQVGSSGTPVYMAPQQMMGEKPAVTDDLYALGATLYELLTGKPPFHSGNIVLQVQSKVAPSIAERRKEFGIAMEALPPAWEETIAAMLAKDAKDRPQSAGEVAARLGLGPAPLIAARTTPTPPPIVRPAASQPTVPAGSVPAAAADPRFGLKLAAVAGLALVDALTLGLTPRELSFFPVIIAALNTVGLGLLVLRKRAGWAVMLLGLLPVAWSVWQIYTRYGDPTYLVRNWVMLILVGIGWWSWGRRADDFGRLGPLALASCLGAWLAVAVGWPLIFPADLFATSATAPSAGRVVFVGELTCVLLSTLLLVLRKREGWLVKLLWALAMLVIIPIQPTMLGGNVGSQVISRIFDLVLYGWGWFEWNRALSASAAPAVRSGGAD